MKTPVKMMNSMVRETRLALAAVLFGVGLSLGMVSLNGEELLFQKIIDSSISDYVGNDHYYKFHRDRLVELGSVSLSNGEELNTKKHFIQTEKLDSSVNKELVDFTVTENVWEGVILLTVKFPEFSQPLEITFNHAEISGLGNWKALDSGGFVGGLFPIKGPAVVSVSITPYAVQLKSNLNSSRWKTFYPKQNWRVILEKTKATYAKSTGQQQVLVLPKGSGVNELVLESSEDLVNWEKDSLGDKNTDAANRFYRLRAVKK
jgi:hypothetical protein